MNKIALLVVESVVLCVLLEVGVRLWRPEMDVPHMRVHAAGYYTWYPGARFTYRNLPNVEPRSASVRINALSLRGPEVPSTKAPHERRVLVLGDSYAAGVQLPEEDVFASVLEHQLAARSAAPYRVLNAGVNGAGTAEELLYFQREGAALDPDVVVLQYAWNDVADTLRHGGFRLTDTGIALRSDLQQPAFWRDPLLALRDAIANRSLVMYLLFRAVAGRGPPSARAEESSVNPGVTLVVRIATELVHDANQRGVPVVILTIPEPLPTGGVEVEYPQVVAGFQRIATGENQLIVADRPLRAAVERGEGPYLLNDGHLSAAGHRLIADLLAPAVIRYEARE